MEFYPTYTITNKTLNNIRDIHKVITELNTKKIPNHIYSQLVKETNIQNTYHSFALSDPNITLKKVKDIVLENSKEDGEETEKILNYYNTITKLNKRKPKDFDLELIKLIHTQLMKNILGEQELGNLRNENTNIKNRKTGKIIYAPPSKKEIKNLIKGLIKYINKNQEEIDPLILAGIFHKQFLIIHPFKEGNGNTCQILTRILISNTNLNFFNLLNMTNYYKLYPKRYFLEVTEMGNFYAIRNKIDFTKWLEYFTEGMLFEILQLKKEIFKQKTNTEFNITKDQEKIINYLEKHGRMTDHEYSKITKRKKSTRVVDFNKLIEMCLIKRNGKARQTFYTLNN